LESAKRAVIRVGTGGRGFIASTGDKRYVVTAARCVPHSRFPRPHLANSAPELIFCNLIGPLASKQRTIWAELCAVSLCDDLAVFNAPDGQDFYDQYAQYEEFTEQAAIPIGLSPDALPPHQWKDHPGTSGYMLSLDGEWQRCTVHNGGRFLQIETDRGFQSGMSGSPIINDSGAAIGIVSTSGAGGDNNIAPSLSDCLPPWLLREAGASSGSPVAELTGGVR
jgi:hypothetical protein